MPRWLSANFFLRRGRGVPDLALCGDARQRRAGLLTLVWLASAIALAPACAALQNLARIVQPPRFEEAPGRQHEVRLQGPSLQLPAGSLAVRLWTRVTNPNPFGFTLSTLKATLLLDDTRATTSDFPLGLPLEAGGSSVVPLDLVVSFADLPVLADTLRAVVRGTSVPYRVDAIIGVAAGQLGTPTFGPMTILRGNLGARVAASADPTGSAETRGSRPGASDRANVR